MLAKIEAQLLSLLDRLGKQWKSLTGLLLLLASWLVGYFELADPEIGQWLWRLGLGLLGLGLYHKAGRAT